MTKKELLERLEKIRTGIYQTSLPTAVTVKMTYPSTGCGSDIEHTIPSERNNWHFLLGAWNEINSLLDDLKGKVNHMNKNEKAVDEWNKKHPPNTPVTVTEDNGNITETRTRSKAWILGDHTPVVLLDDRSGGYLLDRVKPRT